MNARTDGWESYTDDTGRHHWRWPAADWQREAGRPLANAGPRQKIGVPQQQKAQRSPLPPTGK